MQEIRNRYQKSFAEGVTLFNRQIASGRYPFGREVPEDLQRGLWADRYARNGLKIFTTSIGVPEGPGQLIALNRWAYIPDGSGQYVQPDVLIDNGLVSRHVLDGKATRFEQLGPAMLKQLIGYYGLGAQTVEATTPYGHILIPREPRGVAGRKR